MTESFREYLRQHWETGCRHGRTLFAEIQELGYVGSFSTLAGFLSPWLYSSEEATALLPATTQVTLKEQCPGFAVMRKLVLGFRTILRVGQLATLNRWMERASKTGIHALERFVQTLKQDLGTVEAAVTEPWSNGPVEGHINRLKMLKRQMYGRAGVELLRARLLPEPVFSA